MKDIQYPEAWRSPYVRVHISQAQRGEACYCFGCNGEMIMRRGEVKRHHFAHKPPLVHWCNGDNALHEAAKLNICEGFLEAVAQGRKYDVGFPCARCKATIRVNCAEPGAGIATEASVVQGTRSDLVIIRDSGERRVIVEIKVTHDLEEKTAEKYAAAQMPVVKVEPQWEALSDLRSEAIGYLALNIRKGSLCSNCTEKQKEELRRQEENERLRHQIRLQLQGIEPRTGELPQIRAITQDRFGNVLHPGTQSKAMANARKLTWLGFRQLPSRATLFQYTVGDWWVFADLDSTVVIPIWKADCCPAIYAYRRDRRKAEGCRECLLEEVQVLLDRYKCPWRRFFEDSKRHSCGIVKYNDDLLDY